jgi:hypothetical protein
MTLKEIKLRAKGVKTVKKTEDSHVSIFSTFQVQSAIILRWDNPMTSHVS